MISIGGYTGPTTAAGRIGVAQFLPSNRVVVNAPAPGAPMGLFSSASTGTPSDAPPGATELLLRGGDPDGDLLSST